MRGKESRNELYRLAENQPDTNNKRPRIHKLSEKQLCNFWKRVYKSQQTCCWNWTGGRNGSGRAIIKLYGIQMLAPRVSYALHNEVDPGQWDALHTCDNPGCINPDHIFLGTPQDNMKDCIEKDRFVASCGNTKIKPGSKEESILLDASIPPTVAAKMLDIHRKTVWQRRREAGKVPQPQDGSLGCGT